MPEITVNYLAIIVCVVVAMPIGFLWFGPLLGKPWARHMGMEDMEQPGGAEMTKSMALFALGNFLIALVLAHSIEAWQPSTWNYGPDGSPAGYALNAAIWTWIGFFVPLQIGRVAWEKKKWGLVLINSSFDLVRLLVFGFILAYWQ
ncbi:MAG: DUF1761 domain-containing protein [Rhodothermia bacterium]|nr:DUF1761 domain-containing protein [Rhodothermia bacterium]